MSLDTFDEDLQDSRHIYRRRLSGNKIVLYVVLPTMLLISMFLGLWFSGAIRQISEGDIFGPAVYTGNNTNIFCFNDKGEVLEKVNEVANVHISDYNFPLLLSYRDKDTGNKIEIYSKNGITCKITKFYINKK